jgi:hypothetical protein
MPSTNGVELQSLSDKDGKLDIDSPLNQILYLPRSTAVWDAAKAGAYRVVDNQWNHELSASQARTSILVALPSSVLRSVLSPLPCLNSLILLTLEFWHGFRPACGSVTVLARLTWELLALLLEVI